MIEIKLIPNSQINEILPIVKEFNPSLDKEVLTQRLEQMLEQGYECAGCYLDQKLVGVCGLWTQTKFYCGKFIEPDNVYITKAHQGKKLGKALIEFVFELGRQRGCDVSELNCYIDNDPGKAFWNKQGYKAIGYHFQKSF